MSNAASLTFLSVPASMIAGQAYEITVVLLNSGSTLWLPIGSSQNPHRLGFLGDRSVWQAADVELPVDPRPPGLRSSVAPGQAAVFSFTVTAPRVVGSYPLQWQMLQEGVGRFGETTPLTNVAVVSAPRLVAVVPISPVEGGTSTAVTVTLADPAPAGGFTVVLTSGLGCVTPQAMQIPAGQLSASCKVLTTRVAQEQAGQITATLNGQSISAPLVVQETGAVANAQSPLAGFAATDSPAMISYNVPEGVSYSGRHYVELPLLEAFSEGFFSAAARQTSYALPAGDAALEANLDAYMAAGFVSNIPCDASKGVVPARPPHDWYLPAVPFELIGRLKKTPRGGLTVVTVGMNEDGTPQVESYSGVYLDNNGTSTIEPLTPALRQLTAEAVAAAIRRGLRLRIFLTESGRYDYKFLAVPKTATPRLAIVEEYRLTSFLGKYGVGRTLKTLTLLPGEKTNLTIKAYSRTTTTARQASSIFDSATQEAADDFQEMVDSENTDRSASSRSDEWQVDVSATARWGVGHASVSAGAAGSASTSREQLSKSVQGAAKKHADKASSKRDVSIEQASETRSESGEETGTMREIQNLNVGRTLSFVFRQLNQEFISLLHLVDVRLAFANGMPGSERIVSLEEMDGLLRECIADGPAADPEANRNRVRSLILSQLDCVIDFQGRVQSIHQARTLAVSGEPQRQYYRIRRDLTSYTDDGTGATFRVPGIIVSVERNVLRTDGVVVETLLGAASGLDVYSAQQQQQALGAKATTNDGAASRIALERTKQAIVRGHQRAAAQAFVTMFPPPPPPTTTTTTTTTTVPTGTTKTS